MEKRLAESQKYRSHSEHLLQHMSEGFLALDRELYITDANQRFERFHGPKSTLIGQHVWDVMPEVKGTRTDFELQACLANNEVRTFEDYNPKFQHYYDIRLIPTPDGISIFYNDITSRKNKERQLIEVETKFRRLAESNIIGIVRFDEAGKWLEANDAILTWLGYSRSDLERGILNMSRLTPIEFHAIDEAELLNLKHHGYMKPYEKEFFHRDGTRIPVLMSAAGFDKNTSGGMAYIQDISSRKSSEERIRLCSEASGIAFWDWEIGTDEVNWINPWPFFDSNQLRAIPNYKATSAQFAGVIHPDDRELLFQKLIEAITEHKIYRHEFRLITPNGQIHWAQGYGRTFYDGSGRPYRMVGTISDITSIKRASEKLEESEQLYKKMALELEESHRRLDVALSVAQMSVWEIHFSDMTNTTYSNKNSHVFGLPEIPSDWSAESFYESVHPDDRALVRETLYKAANGLAKEQSLEFRVIWPDQSVHWLYSRARVVEDKNGKPERLVGAAIEITKLKETQMKLQLSINIRDEFLSVASHELRTPITSLNLQTQILQRLLQQNISGQEEQRLRRHLDSMKIQIKKLTSLVDDLLDVTRIANGKLVLAPERFDLVDLVHSICDSMQEQFITAQCKVDVIADGSAIGDWDRQKIEQVVVNLLSNACKYGRGKPVRVFVLKNGNMARLIVKDMGIGISEEFQSRIFERFERAVRGSAFSGLGLGLFISKQIVKAHKGEINVYSQEGLGATFTVDLPLAPEANPHHHHEQAGAS